MNILDIIKLKYPDADFENEILVQDDGDGPYIKIWKLNAQKPTARDLSEWAVELRQEYIYSMNRIANKSIYDQLDVIDLKSIRALRTNDTVKLASLEAEAIGLRSQLLPTS